MKKLFLFFVLFLILVSSAFSQGTDYISEWLVLGTFPNTDTETILSKEYIKKEGQVIPSIGDSYVGKEWRVVKAKEQGRVNFNNVDFEEHEYCVVYAHIYVYSDAERNVIIHIGSDDGVALYVNGSRVHFNKIWRGWSPDQDRVLARIGEGWNRLLFKVFNGGGGFDLSARITDTEGDVIPDLRYKVDNPYKGQEFARADVQPWVVCDKIEYPEKFQIEEHNFIFPFKLYLRNLGTEEIPDLTLVLKGLDKNDTEILSKYSKLTLNEDGPEYLNIKEKELLTLLKAAEELQLQIKWSNEKSVSYTKFDKNRVLKAILNTDNKQIPFQIKNKLDYLRTNIDWALYFAEDRFKIEDNYVLTVTESFFSENWIELDKKLEDKVSKIKSITPGLKKNTIYFTGNAHIDIAWLWKFEETVQVCYETFRSALDFADKYDFFIYSQSQAQAYWWMENRFPKLFKEIREKINEGQWEVVGGMWVEPDLNIPSGEALARQILYGKRYFLKKFGIDINVGYNPDTFGYCWTLPQIFKKAGIGYFITQKIGWNDTNKFPYRAFWWKSPDGSKVLTFFPFTYVHNADPERTASQFLEYKKVSGKNDQLVLYGVGNHGGGPTQKNIDNIQKMKKIDAFPKVVTSSTRKFMEILDKKYDEFPVWDDELYLEYHRGTYTTQAKTKKNNRKSEIYLEEAEKYAVISGIEYPVDELNEAWRLTLFNQFHDILPGSSIPEVYDDADVQYENVKKLTGKVIKWSTDKIINSINYKSEGIPVVVFNPLSWARSDIVEFEVPSEYKSDIGLYDYQDNEIPYEIVDGEICFSGVEIPSVGYKTFYLKEGRTKRIKQGLKIGKDFLENEFLRIEINTDNGNIKRIYDKTNKKEVLEEGREGNILEAFEDIPDMYDAWNIGYTGKNWKIDNVKNIFIKTENPQKVVLRIIREYNKSTFAQDLVLNRGIPRLDIENSIDWNESHVLLKAAFNLNVKNEEATFEIPFGTIRRATIPRNKFEEAKFEVSGHKWIDLTDEDGDYGVSMLNDCKYGFDFKGSKMRITLLRSPKSPDPKADIGKHKFTYSIYPHNYGWKKGRTFNKAYELNYPMTARISPKKRNGNLLQEFSFIKVENPGIVVSAIKKAEDSDNIILRFYEIFGKDTDVKIIFNKKLKGVKETDLIERPIKDIKFIGKELIVKTKPYEIKTLLLEF